MPEFTCRIAAPSGEIFERTYVSFDETALRRELETQDLLILEVKRRNPVIQLLMRTFRLRGRIAPRDFLFFNQELRALVRAGLPIIPSLDILLERRKNNTFRNCLIDVRDRVKGGEALSDAFAAQHDLFPRLYCASLASGERSGELALVLERFVAYSQKVMGIRRKVVSALIYPSVLVALSIGLVALLVLFIIPKFKGFLTELNVDLPLITRIVLGISTALTSNWQVLIAATIVGSFTFLWWSRTDAGRMTLDRAKLRIPLVGRVVSEYAQNRFTRTLATLQAGGIPLVTSLELSARAVGNLHFEQELLKVAGKVREGQALWDSLDQTQLLSDLTIQMIKVGESTGALEEMLNNASDFMDEEIDAHLDRMMSLVEPLMLVFMAIVVALMLLSVYYPLIQAYGNTQA